MAPVKIRVYLILPPVPSHLLLEQKSEKDLLEKETGSYFSTSETTTLDYASAQESKQDLFLTGELKNETRLDSTSFHVEPTRTLQEIIDTAKVKFELGAENTNLPSQIYKDPARTLDIPSDVITPHGVIQDIPSTTHEFVTQVTDIEILSRKAVEEKTIVSDFLPKVLETKEFEPDHAIQPTRVLLEREVLTKRPTDPSDVSYDLSDLISQSNRHSLEEKVSLNFSDLPQSSSASSFDASDFYPESGLATAVLDPKHISKTLVEDTNILQPVLSEIVNGTKLLSEDAYLQQTNILHESLADILENEALANVTLTSPLYHKAKNFIYLDSLSEIAHSNIAASELTAKNSLVEHHPDATKSFPSFSFDTLKLTSIVSEPTAIHTGGIVRDVTTPTVSGSFLTEFKDSTIFLPDVINQEVLPQVVEKTSASLIATHMDNSAQSLAPSEVTNVSQLIPEATSIFSSLSDSDNISPSLSNLYGSSKPLSDLIDVSTPPIETDITETLQRVSDITSAMSQAMETEDILASLTEIGGRTSWVTEAKSLMTEVSKKNVPSPTKTILFPPSFTKTMDISPPLTELPSLPPSTTSITNIQGLPRDIHGFLPSQTELANLSPSLIDSHDDSLWISEIPDALSSLIKTTKGSPSLKEESTITPPFSNISSVFKAHLPLWNDISQPSVSSELIQSTKLEYETTIVTDILESAMKPTSVLSEVAKTTNQFLPEVFQNLNFSTTSGTAGTSIGIANPGVVEFFHYSNTTTQASSDVIHLKIATADQKPFVMRDMTSQGEVYSGFVVDLIQEISRRAGFTYDLVNAGSVGAPRGNKWTGIIGELIDGDAEIGAGAITVTSSREEVVDFSKPFMANSINLLVQKPSWSSLGLGYLVRPFSSDYWIMLMVCLLLVGIVFFLIGKFSPYEWGNVAADRDPRGAKNSFTFRNSYLFALSTITWQGFREAPKSLSGRIMAAFWFLFVLFTLIAYTGNLTAYLLVRPEQIPDMPFRTYEDVLESSHITVGAINFGSTQEMLRTSRGETMKALWSKINNIGSWVGEYEEGVQRVETSNGSFVMFMESTSAEYFARKHEDCNLMVYGENLFPSSMAFAVKKTSGWRDKINNALRDIREDGFLQQLTDKYWRFSGKCDNVDGRDFVQTGSYLSSLPIYPISLKDMAVAILLFFLGMVVAFIFLAIEIVHYAVTKKGKKIEKPNILKNPPKIFRGRKAAKPAPEDPEAGAGPSSGDALESVPLEDAEEPATSSGDELRPEGEAAKA